MTSRTRLERILPTLVRPLLMFIVALLFSATVAHAATRNVNVANTVFTDSVSGNSTTTINVGDTVHWIWIIGSHSTTSGTCSGTCTPNGLWDSTIKTSGTFDFTFDTPGTYPYFCGFHLALMTGTVIVLPATTVGSSTLLGTSLTPSAVGQSVTFTATVTASQPNASTPTGTVTFKNDGVDIGPAATLNGQAVASINTASLTAGTHSITAHYSGDSKFNPSDATPLSQVVKITTTTAVGSSLNPSDAGQAVTFTATITNTGAVATGTVSFRDNGVEFGPADVNQNGIATFQTSALAVGAHPITAVYSGDSTHFTSTSGILTQTVNTPPPPVNFSPGLLDFGGVVVSRASGPKTVTLSNHSANAVSTSAMAVNGDYSQSNDCPASLAVNASCTVSVVFTPHVTGTQLGQLTLAGSGANDVSLTGSGVDITLPPTRSKKPSRILSGLLNMGRFFKTSFLD